MIEVISAAAFIGAVIVAVTQAIKTTFPGVSGAITILVAAAVGALVGALDVHIGVPDISVAQGIMVGLAAVGVHTTVKSV